MAEALSADEAGGVLAYWFETLDAKARFAKNDDVDAEIRARFEPLWRRLAAVTNVGDLVPSPDQALAAIIVLDQLPRNMFRGTPLAFASDSLALAAAGFAVDRGHDARVSPERRLFFYLPFEHSESMGDQNRSVELIGALGNPELNRYAVAHRDIIARFGRFPHRNAVLGRPSTPEEVEFLKQPGSGF